MYLTSDKDFEGYEA